MTGKRGICWHQNCVPWGCLSLACGYINLLNHEKMCIKSEVEEIFYKLATNYHRNEAFLFTSNFGTNGLSAPAQGLCTCIKSWTNVHIIRGQSYFLKHATSEQSDKTFLLASKIVPKSYLPFPCVYIYMYEIKQSIILNNAAKGSFWNWYKIMGIIKALKCCQNLYQVVVCQCPGFVFKWWP